MGIAERKEREKEQRRQQIIDAAEAVFFKHGFETASMDMVAEQAELSKATLYMYFKSKEELYFHIFKRGEDLLMQMIEREVQKSLTFQEKLLGSLKALVRFQKKHKHYFDVIEFFHSMHRKKTSVKKLMDSHLKEEQERIKLWSDLFEKGKADGVVRPDLDPLRAMVVIWLQFTGFLQRYQLLADSLKQDFGLSQEELLEEAYDLILNGILKK
ncbi:TetR/AcrR family transcriptional regulator [Calditrichota bacterium LG25]